MNGRILAEIRLGVGCVVLENENIRRSDGWEECGYVTVGRLISDQPSSFSSLALATARVRLLTPSLP